MMKVGEKDFADMWTLYSFYYAKARHDKTNQPWAVDRYCMKGLGWGKDRFYRIKKKLLDNNFIEQVLERRKGRYGKFYIKVNYMSKKYYQCPGNKDNGSSPVSLKTGVRESRIVGNQDTNALSVSQQEVLKVQQQQRVPKAIVEDLVHDVARSMEADSPMERPDPKMKIGEIKARM
jgi:hypothetical protein